MKLAISNIAWDISEEPKIASLLQRLGVRYVEIAPTKLKEDPTKLTQDEITAYKTFWESYGIEVVAFQSMLFTRPDLKIFETEENRAQTLKYLQDYVVLAGRFGVKVMVFGSPKNRQRGDIDDKTAYNIAKPFFDTLGTTAAENDTLFCIEPNASQYACDFVTTAREGRQLVEQISNPGFGLHLDIACMSLASDDVAGEIINSQKLLQHFHISSPMLDAVRDRDDIPHRQAADALKKIGYEKFVSIEMRPGDEKSNLARVKSAVEFVQKVYDV